MKGGHTCREKRRTRSRMKWVGERERERMHLISSLMLLNVTRKGAMRFPLSLPIASEDYWEITGVRWSGDCDWSENVKKKEADGESSGENITKCLLWWIFSFVMLFFPLNILCLCIVMKIVPFLMNLYIRPSHRLQISFSFFLSHFIH